MVRMRRAAASFGLVLLPIVVLACSFGGGPTADPAKVLQDAGPALGKVRTASVELKFGAGATFFGFTVVSASGKVKLPTDSQVTIKAKQSADSLIEIGVTTVGTQTWVTVPFLGVQEVMPVHYGTFPILTGTPDELREALAARGLDAVHVHSPEPGAPFER